MNERGLTLIELCVVILIVAILLATGVATLLRARTAGNETSAAAALRTITSAQFAYASACGGGNYATSLPILATVPPGNSQGYLSEDLGSAPAPQRSGYTFNLMPGAGGAAAPADCNGIATQTRYYAIAVPVLLGNTGTRSFATSQDGAVWQAEGGVPPSEPFGPPAQPVQ